MKIQTTINIKNYYLKLLDNAALVTGQSRRFIISSLMLRISMDHDALVKTWEQIEYQKKGNSSDYHRLHIGLKPAEYELFLDLRKFFKQSVSLLLTHAIDEYLDEMIKAYNNSTDNYPVVNYILKRIIIDNVVSWILSWGVTRKLLAHPLYSVT